MKVIRIVFVVMFVIWLQPYVMTTPLIQKITNDTDFSFVILSHSDKSDCSLDSKSVIIQPRSEFIHEFLIELGEPSLVLRPVSYTDPLNHQTIWMTDHQSPYEYKPLMVEDAFKLYRTQRFSAKCRNRSTVWLDHWVGRDLFVIPNQVEMLGYLLDLSRIAVVNSRHQHVQWLSYSKGIFSKLVLELSIKQSRSHGVQAKLKSLHGEGGVCTNGAVERL